MIELDTPEGREELREYFESIGLRLIPSEGVHFVEPIVEQDPEE